MNHPMRDSTYFLTGSATHPGREHTVNEDSLGLPEGITDTVLARKGYLYIVADGVGQAGDIASQMAVEIIRRMYYEDVDPDIAASLQRAIGAANAEIHRRAQEPAYAGMGTTVVAAVVRGDELVVANAGDSRAYLLRRGTLQQLTSDHTWVAERVAAGILTAEEATRHDMRHIVTRSLGAKPLVEADVSQHLFLPGDRLLLCTDGVWEPVPDREMARLLKQGNPRTAANALVSRAVAAGGADDATALVVETGPVHGGMSAPLQGRVVVIGVGAILILALSICGIARLLSGSTAESPPMTATPLAPSSVMSEEYCIAPLSTSPDRPAKVFDNPDNCQEISGTFIPVDETIWMPMKNVYRNCETNQVTIIQVTYDDHTYWISPWRIGRRSTDGTCQPISNWLRLFASSRQPQTGE